MIVEFKIPWPKSEIPRIGGGGVEHDLVVIDLPWIGVTAEHVEKLRLVIAELYNSLNVTVVDGWKFER